MLWSPFSSRSSQAEQPAAATPSLPPPPPAQHHTTTTTTTTNAQPPSSPPTLPAFLSSISPTSLDTISPTFLNSISPTFLNSISPMIPLASFAVGLTSGLYTGGSKAGLVFMAENAHRRPDTVQGWYFYNKTKNYKMMLAAVKTGLATGIRLGVWTGLWTVADAAALLLRKTYLDETSSAWMAYAHQRGSVISYLGRWTDGLLAGQVVALVASAAFRLPPFRFLALGTAAGGTTGAMQDARDYLARMNQLPTDEQPASASA